MTKQKDKRAYPHGFYLIDNRISLYRLRPIELAVYCCLCRHGNAHHLSHLRMATIADEAGCSVSSARVAVHSLEERGLISISPDYKDAPGGGKWCGANYYEVLELPEYVHRNLPHEQMAGTPSAGAMKNNRLNNTDTALDDALPF